MSNKYTDNNDKQIQASAMQQQSDEAFINELYNEVSEEEQSQPSELLDQRIINAAHKAVEKPKNSRSNLKWYSSLATAASLTLVISLVVLQQSNIVPNEQANNMLKQGITLQKPMISSKDNESLADQEVVAEQMEYQARESYSTKMATKERMVRTTQYEKKAKLSKQKSFERMIAASPVFMAHSNQREESKTKEDKTEIIDLSIKQFHQYILLNDNLNNEDQWVWSLESENNMAYMISIYQNKLQPLQYSLDKSTYKIIVKPKDINKEPSLKNKNLLEITIINR
jgi:hypothetical protein